MNGSLATLLMVFAPALQTPDEAELPEDGGVHVRLQASAWLAFPSGWISITRGSKPGTATTMSVGDEFHLDPSVEPLIELDLALGRHHSFGARFWTVSMAGTGTDDDPFVYHGVTFDAGRLVRAEVDFALLDVGYRYTFNPDDDLRVSAMLGPSTDSSGPACGPSTTCRSSIRRGASIRRSGWRRSRGRGRRPRT